MTRQAKAMYLVFLQNTIAFTVLTVGRIALALYALHMGAGTTVVGLVSALLYLPSLVIALPAGMFADRHGSRWLFVASTAITAAGMLAPLFWATVPALCVGAFTIGVSLAVANVLGQNLVGQLSRPEDRVRNFGNYALIGALSNFAGPLLAGFVIDHAGYPASCAVAAALSAAATLLALGGGALLPRGRPGKKAGLNVFATLREPLMRRILIISGIAQVGFDSFSSFMPVYAHNAGRSAWEIGVALSAYAVGSFGMRAVMTRLVKTWGEGTIMAAGFLFGAAAFCLLPLVTLAVAIALVALLFGIFGGLAQPIAMVMLYNSSSQERAGEAMGLRVTINNFMRVVSPTLFGATANTLGIAPLFIGSALLLGYGAYLSRGQLRRGPGA